MHLILLTFGNELKHHYQAVFATLSFLKSPLIERVSIVTDAPSFYALIQQDSRVNLKLVDAATLQAWRGADDFFWRIKIKAKAIEAIIQDYPDEHILYIDSDTFLYGDCARLKARLDDGIPVMHLQENLLSEGKTKTQRQMWKTLAGKSYAGFPIDTQTAMWNAGVVGLPKAQASGLIAETLRLCDALTKTPARRILLEQFAFSVALNRKHQLSACADVIGHYWGSKAIWNERIQAFLVKGYLENLSIKALIAAAAEIDVCALPIYGGTMKKNARRLHRAIDRLFPLKEKGYCQDVAQD